MFPQKRDGLQGQPIDIQALQAVERLDMRETDGLKTGFQRGVNDAAAAGGYKDGTCFPAQGQQGFDQGMIRMIVGDQQVVDVIGQIGQGQAVWCLTGFVGNHRVNEDGSTISGFHQNAGMAEIAPA